ncbi:MAG: hypothetical protein WB820_02020, partial [Rhodoplanes sp.]
GTSGQESCASTVESLISDASKNREIKRSAFDLRGAEAIRVKAGCKADAIGGAGRGGDNL